MLEFTAHNVMLADGSQTLPTVAPLEHGPAYRAVLRTALELCPPIDSNGNRATLVDLGALEGGWTTLFARAGYDTLGIEARESNFAHCEFVREHADEDRLHFALDDVRNLADHGVFDACFCSGLLYHLDAPAELLRLIGDVTSRLLIVHTHYAPDTLEHSNYADHLSDLCVHDGRRGRWFQEWPEDATPAEIETYRWASVGNHQSFWLCKHDLMQAMIDAGFSVVYEQHDFLGDVAGSDYQQTENRSLFIGLKPQVTLPVA